MPKFPHGLHLNTSTITFFGCKRASDKSPCPSNRCKDLITFPLPYKLRTLYIPSLCYNTIEDKCFANFLLPLGAMRNCKFTELAFHLCIWCFDKGNESEGRKIIEAFLLTLQYEGAYNKNSPFIGFQFFSLQLFLGLGKINSPPQFDLYILPTLYM